MGFLLEIENSTNWSERDILSEDFRCVFTELGNSYFKNCHVRQLDESIGDLDAVSACSLHTWTLKIPLIGSAVVQRITDKEKQIVAALEEDILDCETELRHTFNALAELDCILAFSHSALDYNYVRPKFITNGESCIKIVNGRHPLQEIVLEKGFIPNSTNADVVNRVNIVTGPNFSGKSCYARQVGTLVYMAHIGSFIPCDDACLSVVDKIFARFSSVETCAVPQSSFQLDLTNIGAILRRVTPRSLVVSHP